MNFEIIQGKCMQMCPYSEIKMREKEGLLHRLEILSGTESHRRPKAHPKKVVKCFSRSAAGQRMPTTNELRPAPILEETISYLLNDVITVDDMPWNIVYDFIFDRLRAVRQDMVIQSLSSTHSAIQLLEPIILFHAFASYRLCEEHLHNFDPVINTKHLMECLKQLLVLYDETEFNDVNFVNNYNQSYYNNSVDKNNTFFKRQYLEALYLLVNIGDTTALLRALNLSKNMRTGVVKQALIISLAWYNRNYIRVCRLMQNLPLLLAAVTVLHLPLIRRVALQIMCTAYNNKNLSYPAHKLKDALIFNDIAETINEIRHYNIQNEGSNIIFNKQDFDYRKPPSSLRRLKFVDEMLRKHSIPELIFECI